jgi:uncharacterized membrane protein YjjP (DUF1212 family)
MKNLINSFLGQQDKICHFFASGWIFLVLNYFFEDMAIPFFITLLIGLVKEVYDWKYRNGADFYDIVANVLGIFVSMIVFIEL